MESRSGWDDPANPDGIRAGMRRRQFLIGNTATVADFVLAGPEPAHARPLRTSAASEVAFSDATGPCGTRRSSAASSRC
jgi:hypothetical protein